MLDKETVSKMGLYKVKGTNRGIEENLLVCIDKAGDLIDEEDPLNECFSKVKDIAK